MSSLALAGGSPSGPYPLPALRLPTDRHVPPGRLLGLPISLFSLVAVLLLHALVLFWLLNARLTPPASPAVDVIQAALIAAEPLPMADIEPIKEPPRIEPAPPKPAPKPIPQRKEVMLPKLVAPPDAPSMDSAPPQAPAPEEPVPIDAAPASAPPAPAAPAAAPAPPTAGPPPVEPPRFDAAYLSNPKPAYPPMSRRMGEEGRVSLLVMVEPDGSPSKVEIHVSSGFPRLDQAALEAVRKWKFVPARRGTEALASPIIVPLSFSLPR